MFSYFKKLLKLLIDYPARIAISRNSNVKISDSAKIGAYRNLQLYYGSKLLIGDHTVMQGTIVTDRAEARVVIGARTFIGGSTIVSATEITIGDDVLIAWGCTIIDHDSHSISWSKRSGDVADWVSGKKDWQYVTKGKIHIDSKAWIGANVIVLKNVSIGEGAVVGAGSVVTTNVPPWVIVAGNPASVVRMISEDER